MIAHPKVGIFIGSTGYVGSLVASTLVAVPTPEQLLAEHWPLLALLGTGLLGLLTLLIYVGHKTLTLYMAAQHTMEATAKTVAATEAKAAIEVHALESSTRNRRLVEDHVAVAIRDASREWRVDLTQHTHNEEMQFAKIFTEQRYQRAQNEQILGAVARLAEKLHVPSTGSLPASVFDSSPGKK